MQLRSFSKPLVLLTRESPRAAVVMVAAFLLAACAGGSIFYGSQHPGAVAVIVGIYGIFAVATLALVKVALPFIER